MSVRITLTDDVFPPSSEFIDFLQKWISNEPFDGTSWRQFGSERVRMLGRAPPATPSFTGRKADRGRRGEAIAFAGL